MKSCEMKLCHDREAIRGYQPSHSRQEKEPRVHRSNAWHVLREASPEAQPQPQKKRRVWEDPDDPALVVPVAGQARLRKLRNTEEEAQLTGVPLCVAALQLLYIIL